jgi:[ribosomal protein S5]-alanine N-acetyltransferase
MKNPFLIGDQLYLRPLELEDAGQIVPWLNDPEVTRTVGMYRPSNLETETEFLRQAMKDERQLLLGVALRSDDELIGVAGLRDIEPRTRQACFGISLGEKSEWRKGHGTEATRLVVRHAFETLNLHRVWLHVYETNPGGIRAYEKVGFRREGVLRESTYREGQYWDTIAMAILRSEWDSQRSG